MALFRAPPFVALSYCWGDLADTICITVNDLEVLVTVNLHAALRQLRAVGVKFVWVDALCINQQDREERSIQIRRMSVIYKKAKQVTVWLGDEQDIEEDDIISLSVEGARTAHHAVSVSARRAIMQLLSRPYWTRVWIIQELAAASSIIILCGRHMIPWDIFPKDSPPKSVAVANEISNDMLETGFRKLREFRTDKLARKPISLLDALYRSQSTLSTDPKDKLYALLGLVFDGDSFIPEPNYNLSTEEIYTDFSLALIENGLPLDFIYLRTSNRGVYDSLPSWVVDWSDLNDDLARQEFEHILKSVLPEFSRPHFDQQNQARTTENTLVVRGSILGTIDGLSSTFSIDRPDFVAHVVFTPEKGPAPMQPNFDCSSYIFDALLERRRLSAAGVELPLSSIRLWSSVTERELRNLFDKDFSPAVLERLLDWFNDNRSLAAFGSTMEYWDGTWTSQPSDKDWSPSQTIYLRSLLTTIISGMRIAILETGELGWVHPQGRKGDKIAKIFGCDRHVVLRLHLGGYRMIGEARPYWLASKLELLDKIESLTIF